MRKIKLHRSDSPPRGKADISRSQIIQAIEGQTMINIPHILRACGAKDSEHNWLTVWSTLEGCGFSGRRIRISGPAGEWGRRLTGTQ